MKPSGLILHFLISAGGLPPEPCQHVNVLLAPIAVIWIRQDAPRAIRAFLRLKNVGGKLCAPHLRAAGRGSTAELAVVEM